MMNFTEIAEKRQSCREYNGEKAIESKKLDAILNAARLAPSACNGQPYHTTVCRDESAKQVASLVTGMGMNKFAANAPVLLVISEEDYVASAALGARVKGNDYRSIDIGIVAAYITAEATAQGLGSCILGWFDDKKIREVCGLTKPVRLVITLGYAAAGEKLRSKKRKEMARLVSEAKPFLNLSDAENG
jgi:nitroreductase